MLNFFNGVSIESGKISPLSNFFELMSQKQSSQAILFSLSILLVFPCTEPDVVTLTVLV